MSKIVWTNAQIDAIKADGGRILVSAAAGSGKTAVLVERVIRKIVDTESKIDADKILVATFSNAAASEMLGKIEKSLSKLIVERPDDWFLQRQKIKLNYSSISTVHSFCLNLIRDNFHLLNINSDFRIGDPSELSLIQTETVNEVLEKYYDEKNQDFLDLVEFISDSRNDNKLMEEILNIYKFISSHPFPSKWLDDNLKEFNPNVPIEKTNWGKIMYQEGKSAINHLEKICEKAIKIIRNDENMEKAYIDAFLDVFAQIQMLSSRINKKDWDNIVKKVESFEFPKRAPLRGYSGSVEKEIIDDIWAKLKDTMKTLTSSVFFITSKEHKGDMESLEPKVKVLFNIVKDYSDLFFINKQKINILDFSDLEHLTLKLLLDFKSDGNYKKSEVAKELSSRFDMILVDEYQDTNEVQDLIFKTVSKNEKNLFMVGDVKQSIYSFREAMPEIFLEKRRGSTLYERDKKSFPATIILGENFRSRKEICDGINTIFENLMSEDVGGVKYDDQERLISGSKKFSENEDAKVSILAVSAEDENKTRYEQESEVIAEKITNMIDTKYLVYDDDLKDVRPCRYEDFCVLLRSRTHITKYEKAFEEVGIPTWTDFSESFFTSKEIMYVTSFLKVIDNPLLDIEITSAMMSPMFGFTPDEMAEIRLLENGPMYLVLQNEKLEDNQKIQDFLEILDELRTYCVSATVDKVIQKIFELTFFDLYVRAMKNGSLRLFNLHLLIKQAKDYENAGYRGLSGFNRLINRMMEENLDIGRDMSLPTAENVVKIMTMHRSKGLEFPIVFVVACSQAFNLMDLRKQTLLHSKYGFGCKNKDLKTLKRYSSLPFEALKIAKKKESLSEEIRVLYVAMTRAEENLFLVCSDKKMEKKLNKLSTLLGDEKIDPFSILGLASFSDWILLVYLKIFSEEFKKPFNLFETQEKENLPLFLEHHKIEALEEETIEKVKKVFIAKEDKKLFEIFKKRMSHIYSYDELTTLPSKVGVSQLAEKEIKNAKIYLDRPQFMYSLGLSPAEKGNAHHTFMQFANYENAKKSAEHEINELLEKKYLTKEQAEAIDPKKIKNFFNSDIAVRMFKSNDVRRELKFIVAMNQNNMTFKENMKYSNEDTTMIQGVVDCAFIENDKIIILDYKTDSVKESSELINRYKMQLEIYAQALEESLQKKVHEKIIYSFHLDEAIFL